MLSARNQLAAVVKSVKLGNVMAEVVVDVAGTEVVAIITRGSAEALKLQPGDHVKAVIKSTAVLRSPAPLGSHRGYPRSRSSLNSPSCSHAFEPT
ncbi:MAG: TOBE domain-containing protein [Isosphaeraceae bacterium]